VAEQEEDEHPTIPTAANDPHPVAHCLSHIFSQLLGPLPHDILHLDVQVLSSHTPEHPEYPHPTPQLI